MSWSDYGVKKWKGENERHGNEICCSSKAKLRENHLEEDQQEEAEAGHADEIEITCFWRNEDDTNEINEE